MKGRKKIAVVTGGGGFIGANLVRRLIRENYEIHLIWKKTTKPWRLLDVKSQIKLHEIELTDREKLLSFMEFIMPTAIFHLAAHGSYPNQTDIDEMIKVNVVGTLNLLFASQDVPYKAFVYTGSSSEYGFKTKPIKETDFLDPISFYAGTKGSGTLLCNVFAREYKKPVIILRPFSIYGPYEEPSRFIPTIINSLIKNRPIKITSGLKRRDFTYIDDVLDIYLSVVQKGNKLSGEIFNMGAGKEYSNDEVVEALFRITGKKVPIEKGVYPTRMWDTSHWVADVSKIKELLDIKPKYSLEKGLLKTYNWFLKHTTLVDKYYG